MLNSVHLKMVEWRLGHSGEPFLLNVRNFETLNACALKNIGKMHSANQSGSVLPFKFESTLTAEEG